MQKVQQINRRQAKSLISSAKNLMKARIENILKKIKKKVKVYSYYFKKFFSILKKQIKLDTIKEAELQLLHPEKNERKSQFMKSQKLWKLK